MMLISENSAPFNPLNLSPGDLLFSQLLHDDLQNAVFRNTHLMQLCDLYYTAAELSQSYKQRLLRGRLRIRSGFTASAKILCDERAHLFYDMIRLQKFIASIGRGRALHISENFVGLTSALAPVARNTMIRDFRQQSLDANIMYVMADSQIRIADSFRQKGNDFRHHEHEILVAKMGTEYREFEKTVKEIQANMPQNIPEGAPASVKTLKEYALYARQLGEYCDQLAKLAAQRAENGINALFTGDAMWLQIDGKSAAKPMARSLSPINNMQNAAWAEQRVDELVDTEIYLQRAVILENRSRSLAALANSVEDTLLKTIV